MYGLEWQVIKQQGNINLQERRNQIACVNSRCMLPSFNPPIMGPADATASGHAILGISTNFPDAAQILSEENPEIPKLICYDCIPFLCHIQMIMLFASPDQDPGTIDMIYL